MGARLAPAGGEEGRGLRPLLGRRPGAVPCGGWVDGKALGHRSTLPERRRCSSPGRALAKPAGTTHCGCLLMTHPDLPAEQAHVDHAYARLQQMREMASEMLRDAFGEQGRSFQALT